VETDYIADWKISGGELRHKRKLKRAECPEEVLAALIEMSKIKTENRVAYLDTVKKMAPYNNLARRLALCVRKSVNNSQDFQYSAEIVHTKRPVITVVGNQVYRQYSSRSAYWVTEWSVKLNMDKRHFAGFEAGLRIGVVDKLHTLYYDDATHYAIWVFRGKISTGYMLPFEGSYVHGVTLKEAQDNIARRLKRKARLKSHGKADFQLARSLGFCAAGIRAWCESNGISTRARLSIEELEQIDGKNSYVQALISVLKQQVAQTSQA
jgi:hypothetical protein